MNDPQPSNPAGWFTRTYTYSSAIPHAVTNVTPETGTPDTYTYDANGNMTCRIENGVVYTHAYNAENRASSIAKRNTDCTGTIIESWSFAYDGDGTRVLTAHFTGTSGTPDSTTAYYMGGAYEVKDAAVKKYYSIAGMMVATQDASGLQYLLTDHLGSVTAVTNSTGTLTSQQRYLPFGGARSIPNSPIVGTDFGYTGQRMLDSGMGGIMDYKARFYSPYLNRFLQPDTIIPDQSNPQSWNRNSYVQNNPVRFNDPTGHMLDDGCRWIGCGDGPSTPPPPPQQPSSTGGNGGCNGSTPSVVCLPPPTSQPPQILTIPLTPTSPYNTSCVTTGNCPPSNSSTPFVDQFFDYLRFGVNFNNIIDIIEDGIQWGRPAYIQIKYAIPLIGYEYAIDGLLQLYDDRNKDLTIGQRFIRGIVRTGESALTDAASIGVGGASAAALQASAPIPFVSAGAGYVVGSYATSTILDNLFVNHVNPYIFNRFLGGP